MDAAAVDAIAAWLTERGLAGASETELLQGFCARAVAAGLALERGLVIIDTLHPVYEGHAFRWRNDGVDEETEVTYGRTMEGGEREASWLSSPFYALLQSGGTEMRRRLGPDEVEFPFLARLRDEDGLTDILICAYRFAREHAIGEMDSVLSHWLTAAPDGFSDGDIAALRRLVPLLSLAAKCASLQRVAGTLVEVYLGKDAGRRVLGGRIGRGKADRIPAVLWFSDLRSYTTISDAAEPGEIIPFLNDYAEAVISAIHEGGGDVLKLIGDGTLAIFAAEDPAAACSAALSAHAVLRGRLAALNGRRAGEGLPVTEAYLGLHIGDVFYGNIGSEERLDFTVVGPAVNETSRIASMCRSADRPILVSSAFCEAAPPEERAKLVSVGRYALRGVGRAQELFTIDPALL